MRLSEKRFWSAQILFSRSQRKLEQVYRTLNGIADIYLAGYFCGVDLEEATNRAVVKIRSDVVAFFAPRWGVAKKIIPSYPTKDFSEARVLSPKNMGPFDHDLPLEWTTTKIGRLQENIWFSSVASGHVSIWKETILGDVKMIYSVDW